MFDPFLIFVFLVGVVGGAYLGHLEMRVRQLKAENERMLGLAEKLDRQISQQLLHAALTPSQRETLEGWFNLVEEIVHEH